MKKFLSVLLALAMIFSLTVTVSADETKGEMDGYVVVLHTNDVHGAISGYAKVAALKKAYEAEGAYVLLMDAGDFCQGDPTVSVSQGKTAVELMNMAGYDVTTLGNHEFDYGYDNLVNLSKEAKFPIVAANVLYQGRWHSTPTRSSLRRPASRSACSVWRPPRPQPRHTPLRSRA